MKHKWPIMEIFDFHRLSDTCKWKQHLTPESPSYHLDDSILMTGRTLLGDMQISLTTIIINMKVPQETKSGCIWRTIWHSYISTVCLPKRPQRVYQRYLHNMFMEALLTMTKLWNKSLYPTRTTIKENRVIKNKVIPFIKK